MIFDYSKKYFVDKYFNKTNEIFNLNLLETELEVITIDNITLSDYVITANIATNTTVYSNCSIIKDGQDLQITISLATTELINRFNSINADYDWMYCVINFSKNDVTEYTLKIPTRINRSALPNDVEILATIDELNQTVNQAVTNLDTELSASIATEASTRATADQTEAGARVQGDADTLQASKTFTTASVSTASANTYNTALADSRNYTDGQLTNCKQTIKNVEVNGYFEIPQNNINNYLDMTIIPSIQGHYFKAVYDVNPILDENGNPILDENGNPIYPQIGEEECGQYDDGAYLSFYSVDYLAFIVLPQYPTDPTMFVNLSAKPVDQILTNGENYVFGNTEVQIKTSYDLILYQISLDTYSQNIYDSEIYGTTKFLKFIYDATTSVSAWSLDNVQGLINTSIDNAINGTISTMDNNTLTSANQYTDSMLGINLINRIYANYYLPSDFGGYGLIKAYNQYAAGTNLYIYLPHCAGVTDGKTITIKKTNPDNNKVIVIQASTGQTIDGASTYTLTNNYQSITMICDKQQYQWSIISKIG